MNDSNLVPEVRRQENMRNLAQGPECHCRSSGSTWDSPCQAVRPGMGAVPISIDSKARCIKGDAQYG